MMLGTTCRYSRAAPGGVDECAFAVILDAQLSPYRRSEMRLADEFLQRIPDHSVMLFDKGFWGAELLSSLSSSGTHRHWLVPAKKRPGL